MQHDTEYLYTRVMILYEPPEDGHLHGRNT